jgi:nucleotide-binding universal stress UspA family protein
MEDGVARARSVGFEAHGRTAPGKPWQVICDIAEEIDASTIVLGARGRSEVQSVLLGSVSAAVATHADRPVLIVPRARD